MKRFCLFSAVALLGASCAHKSLDAAALESIQKPAFVGRISKNAGPKATVFTDDNTFREGLKRLEPAEGNRRMAARMLRGLPHYELSDGLRARTMLRLEQVAPFKDAAEPSKVARSLGIFLMQDEADVEPDYKRLLAMDVDSIVEMVIEEYGIRSAQGKVRFWVRGYGRMFRLKNGSLLWKRSFHAEEEESSLPVVDPFVLAREPSLYRNRIHWVLDTVAQKLSEDFLRGQFSRGQLSMEQGTTLVAPQQEASPVVLPPASQTPARQAPANQAIVEEDPL
ncbi:MAG: hypothetical protein FWG75_07600 [Cystobacterineae bacterium]|nr:hypothetical protein [Cystobacterineae bacterium]